jgi:2-keto-myo-inositol isomerase
MTPHKPSNSAEPGRLNTSAAQPAAVSRRAILAGAGLSVAASLASPAASAPLDAAEGRATPETDPFSYSLNTSTIRGQKLSLVDEIELAAEVGYQAIEPWISELDAYVEAGWQLSDLRKRLEDRGLQVASAIGFAAWIVDDAEQRRAGLEEARRAMEKLSAIGGTRIAAPPAGATDQAGLDPRVIAERYRALCALGDEFGVTPQLEVWGFSRCLGRLGEVVHVTIEADHPRACILPDIYHLYKGGSSFEGLRLLGPGAFQVFHLNDYPAEPPRAEIKDAHRIYPGDGVAPVVQVLREARSMGFAGVLSLELFNPDYWRQDARVVARTGLEKMRAAVRTAMG